MKYWTCALVLAFTSAPAPLLAQEGRVMLVRDGSNSMRARINDTVVNQVAEAKSPSLPIDRSKPAWRLESRGKVYEGRLSRFYEMGGNPMIQLINGDAVNVGLAFDGEMTGDRVVTYAMFVEGRGPMCERVGPEDSFRITFQPSEEGWLTGTFSGTLGCPDYRAMPVQGSFHIRAPRVEAEGR